MLQKKEYFRKTRLRKCMDKNRLIENDLTKRVKEGDRLAFELLFKLYYSQLIRFARVYVKSTDLGEEVVHETFIKIWENRAVLDESQSIKAYLYRSVHNNCINHLKKLKFGQRLALEYIRELETRAEIIQQATGDSYFDEISKNELVIKIKNAVDNLPLQCKEVFLLNRISDLTYQQIAEKLGLSVNTVKTQLSRALHKIKTEIKK